MTDNEEFLSSVARLTRASATPRTASTQYRYILSNLDVRSALEHVQAPTLVLNVRDNPFVPLTQGRYIAERIPDRGCRTPQGGDIGLSPSLFGAIDEIEEFLTGERRQADIQRILATVLFTDIVASTERAASSETSVGDCSSTPMTGRCAQLKRFRGREVKMTGDGFLASSTALLVASGTPKPSWVPPSCWVSSCGLDCTPVSAKYAETTWEDSPSTSPPGLAHWPRRGKSSCPGRSRIWWRDPASGYRAR